MHGILKYPGMSEVLFEQQKAEAYSRLTAKATQEAQEAAVASARSIKAYKEEQARAIQVEHERIKALPSLTREQQNAEKDRILELQRAALIKKVADDTYIEQQRILKAKDEKVLWRFDDLEHNLEMILLLAGMFDKTQYLEFNNFVVKISKGLD